MSLVIRVIAPFGRDAELIVDVLRHADLTSDVCEDLPSLLKRVGDEPIGPLLIAEEALDTAAIEQLGQLLEHQPPWSDLPVLILTGSSLDASQSHRLESGLLPLGSTILLERPIRTATLVSSVRAALRARKRQYEIRDALAELKQERETLHVIVDNLPVGVVLAKPTGEIVLANRNVEQILRHSPMTTSNIESHDQWIAFHPEGNPVKEEEHPLRRAMVSGHPVPPEDFLCRRGDGSLAWVRAAAAPIFDDQGVIAGGVVAISDIDQQKRAESALIQSEKLAAVGRLAASISHEINNPLEAVTNLLYLLEKVPQQPEARHYIATAQQELSRVSQIVTHTLRFHRQSTGPRAITAEELLEPALGLYRGRLTNSNIDLELQQRGAGAVICYEGDIRQVLNNLIGNAIDAMRTGGLLVIRVSRSRLWSTGVPGIRITIADTGQGMPPEVIQHIFEPFYTTKGINGTGLGLWISLGIVVKHQGRLQVRSRTQEGKSGTVFSLFLPADSLVAGPRVEAGDRSGPAVSTHIPVT
jgi:PAS domain S-box-containing protein